MAIILTIFFIISVIGTVFLLATWGLWILGILADFLSGLYRHISGKPSSKRSAPAEPRVMITREYDSMDTAMCHGSKKYKIEIDLSGNK